MFPRAAPGEPVTEPKLFFKPASQVIFYVVWATHTLCTCVLLDWEAINQIVVLISMFSLSLSLSLSHSLWRNQGCSTAVQWMRDVYCIVCEYGRVVELYTNIKSEKIRFVWKDTDISGVTVWFTCRITLSTRLTLRENSSNGVSHQMCFHTVSVKCEGVIQHRSEIWVATCSAHDQDTQSNTQ